MRSRHFVILIALLAGLPATAAHADESFTQELARMAAEASAKAPAERRAVMDRATEQLRASGIAQRAAKVGDKLPAISLPDHTGKLVQIADLLAKGAVVLTFYRGGWCPYCNFQLRAYQKALPELTRHGATLVAISPEKPDQTLSTVQKDGLAFLVLSDAGNAVANRLGLVFQLPDDLKKLYRDFGIDLEKSQGNPEWRLPLPATYVVDRDGRIAWAFVDVDYKKRADPAAIVKALAALKTR